MAALKVRSRRTLWRAGWVCEVKLDATPIRLLEGRDVELSHLQQRLHHLCRVPALRVTHHPAQRGGHDLPRDAEPILEPAARSFLATVGEPCPDLIELILSLAGRDQRERFGEREGRAAVKGRVLLPVEQEAHVPQAAFRERTVAVTTQHAEHLGVWKHRDVEIDRFFGTLLEGQTGSTALHLRLLRHARLL